MKNSKFKPTPPVKQTKFTKLTASIKQNKKYIGFTLLSTILYSVILGLFGIFGNTIQEYLLYFVKNILPVIAICFGYFMTIFVPVRVVQALKRNAEIKEEFEQDKKLQEHANKSKVFQENILKAMGDKGTF